MDGEMWVVPGAPLERGEGWRVWLAREGDRGFQPQWPTVRFRGESQDYAHDQDAWRLFDHRPGLRRRIGVLTIKLADPKPGELYDLAFHDPPGRQVQWRTLPASVEPSVSFMLASCFWQNNDKDGYYAAAVRDITKIEQPAFKLLIGDQVYQDVPLNGSPWEDAMTRFCRRYDVYWGDAAYQEVLTSSPNLFTCDDHEFWNGYPERKLYIPYTVTGTLRAKNREAALEAFAYYQAAANPEGRSYFCFDVGPVSFFVTDTRSQRTPIKSDDPRFFLNEQWTALETWVRELKGPGVLVLGQPLFAKEKGPADPSIQDYKDDFGRLCAVFETAVTGGEGRAKHDILILTGDIHRARHFVGRITHDPTSARIHELVASPASRVFLPVKPDLSKHTMKFQATHAGRTQTWAVEPTESDAIPTADNNVAVIRMSPGTIDMESNAQRVRFELAVWQIRRYTPFLTWDFALPLPQGGGHPKPLYRDEIELR